MRRQFLTILISAFIARGTALLPLTVSAQETKEKPPTAERQTNSPTFYRVDYAIHELEHGKGSNTRNYTLKVEPGNWASFRVGSRIPTPAEKGGFQYFDVGVKLDCNLREHDGSVWVLTKLEFSSVAGSESASIASPPVLRNFSFQDTTPVVPGKPTLVGAIDDVIANRRYEVEVAVTKVK